MIELGTLGGIDLRHADATPVLPVLAQPRRFALLVYLAKAGAGVPPSFHRRDALLAIFWPDADAEHARAALKVGVHFLRRALGEGIIVSRGAGELGVAADAIRCDATAFENAVDAGRLDDAVHLYRGDFLPAFHISGAPDFEDWMERERARLAARYRHALEELARAADDVGNSAGGAALWRRAVDAAPLNSAAVLGLMRALNCEGDRAGALLAAREHERRVRVEVDADIDPSVRSFEQELRRKSPGESAAAGPPSVSPVLFADAGHLTLVAAPEPPNSPADYDTATAPWGMAGAAAARSHPTLRRWSRALGRWRGVALWAVAAATATLTGAAFHGSGRLPNAPAPLRERVLVAPLENRTGDPRLDALGDMAADWIAQGLQETGLAEVVDPLSAMASRRRAEAQTIRLEGLSRAVALARTAGAGSVVWGAVYRSGDSLFFRAQVSDVSAGKLRIALEPVATNATDPRKGVERLRQQLAGALAALLDRRVASVSDPSDRPPTLEAYREYALALENFQRDDPGAKDAVPHFAAAGRLDTTFNSPLVWLVFAYWGQKKQVDSLVALLAARRARLLPLDRYALEFFEADARGDVDAELNAALEAARLSPGSEWSYNAGLILGVQARPREALHYLRLVDPEHGWAGQWNSYWSALAKAHHWLGEYREELAVAERFRTLSPRSRNAQYLEARALMGLGQASAAEVEGRGLLEVAPPPDESPLMLPVSLGREFAGHGYTAEARRLFELAIDWPGSPAGEAWVAAAGLDEAARPAMQRDVALALYELGRWHDARMMFERLSAADTASVELRAGAAIAAAREGDRTAAAAFMRWLGSAEARGARPDAADNYRAKLAAVLGDNDAAVGYLHALSGVARNYYFEIHRESDLQPLRDDPRLRALVRPSQ